MVLSANTAANQENFIPFYPFVALKRNRGGRRDGKLRRDFGDRCQERLGVRILGGLQDLGGGANFDDFARLHDGDAGGELGDDGQAVRDQN